MMDIIIPTFVSPDKEVNKKIEYSVNQCLNSLLETTPEEVLLTIVQNSGEPSPISHPRVKYLYVKEQGQCKAVNAGVATGDSELIMVTNNDMIFAPGWYSNMVLWMDLYDCVSPKLVEPQQGAPTFIEYFCGGAGGDFDRDKFYEFAEQNEGVGATTGFNLPFIITRELWNLIGGYDINYDPWGSNSDSDLEYKIRLAGKQPMQAQNCFVYHFSQTSGTFHPSVRNYWQKNWDYFIEKWGFERTDDGIWQASFEIPYNRLKYKPKWAKLPDSLPGGR